ncbi:hypothetical protein BDZ97DRAFT_102042 [Flammula alnicola]|nr:hypothetical protein BDZ97DRAFT_102042 [Flammula alnicola]
MCNVILSPIRRLPPEILGEIFLVYRVVSGRPVSLRTSPAAVLSQVCRSWRQTAISLPPLWDTLRVDYTLASTLSRPQNQRPLRICRIMDLWFERSNPLPLDFSLQSKHLFAGSGPIHSSIVLSISDVSHRIRSWKSKLGSNPYFPYQKVNSQYWNL